MSDETGNASNVDKTAIKRTVLVLDDDGRVRENLAECLSDAGLHVDTARTFDEAEDFMQCLDYDVVVCDWDLGVYGVGAPGDEVTLLAARANHEGFRLVCFSGLRREVPAGVEQFRKDQVLELRDSLASSNGS